MAVGPCGMEFREAFSCFHYSEADPKGADCIDKFGAMQDCMRQYPDLYNETDKVGAPPEDNEGTMLSFPANIFLQKRTRN